MRYILSMICFLFMSSIAYSADVVVYSTTTFDVNQYLQSVNTPDYDTRVDVLVNPDVSAVIALPIKYWKVSGTDVVEKTQGEKDTTDQDIIAASSATIRALSKEDQRIFDPDGLWRRSMMEEVLDDLNKFLVTISTVSLEELMDRIDTRIDSGTVDIRMAR